MKKTYFFLITCLVAFNAKAQTTLKYSGNATNSFLSSTTKVGAIGENTISTDASAYHIGLVGRATNGIGGNVGILGTTIQSNSNNSNSYSGVIGDNFNNNLSISNAYVSGGRFIAKNSGLNSSVTGIWAFGEGSNNSSAVYGIDATANNFFNISQNKVIAVRGNTISGKSVLTSFKQVANPGGYFSSNDGQGVYGTTVEGYNFQNIGNVSVGVTGYSNIANAHANVGVVGYVEGSGKYKFGVYGFLDSSIPTDVSSGVCGQDYIGSTTTYAGLFYGKVRVDGNLTVNGNSSATGVKTFRIDHPLDPENKILRHAAMESNEVLNQYSGNVTTDASGYATVTLPNYFETLNKDFRYQLTVIGSFSQAIIKQEVINNQFIIQTNQPSIKVSWQVTGVRNDKVMQYQPFVAETEKTDAEKGNYLSPEAYEKPSNANKFISIPTKR